MDSSFRKCQRRRSFLPKHTSSSLIRALFTLVGVGINFKPLDSKEISALDKILVDNKLMTFGLTNLPFNLPSITSAILFSPNMYIYIYIIYSYILYIYYIYILYIILYIIYYI